MEPRGEKKGERGRAELLVLWLGAPVVALLMWLAEGTPWFAKLENVTVDRRFAARAGADVVAPADLVLIGVREADLRAFGRWPWTRSVHEGLLLSLARTEPGAVAMDFLFTEPQGDGALDVALGDAAATVGPVVMAARVDSVAAHDGGGGGEGAGGVERRPDAYGYTLPLAVEAEGGSARVYGEAALMPVEVLMESAYVGFANMPPAGDGVWRRLPLVVKLGDSWYPGFALQTLMIHWGLSVEQVEVAFGDAVVLKRDAESGGEVRVPIDDDGMLLLNWRRWWMGGEENGEGLGLAAYGYSDLLSVPAAVEAGAELFKGVPETAGKIVLVGQVAEGLEDIGASPLDRKRTPGVMTHATAIANILAGDHLREVRGGWLFVLWALLAAAGMRLATRTGAVAMAVSVAVVCVAYAVAAFVLFSKANLLLPVLWPLVGTLGVFTALGGVRWQGELAAKRVVREVFAKIVPPQVMEELMAHPESIDLIGRRRAVAVLFSDIRSFTTISESMEEEALVEQLNDYFEGMVGRIDQTGGTLSKYIGDAIMAVWGDVTSGTPEELSLRATRAALGMKAVLEEMNPAWEAAGKPAFHTGIGINFGEVMVGYIGSARHREFTVIGDAVNTAARLEGLTKGYGAGIAVGESVREQLDEGFAVRTLGLIVVKGKTVPVRVYEVLAEGDAGESAWAARYEEAFGQYLARDFGAAAEGFESCLAERPGDKCCETYASACRGYEKEAPGQDWDGVVVMTSK